MENPVIDSLKARFPDESFVEQETRDEFPTLWVGARAAGKILRFLKMEIDRPYRMLYDLTAIDERERTVRQGQPASDFTIAYHLLSFERNDDIRIKVALEGEYPTAPSVTGLWRNADWYEREVFDMFGVRFEGHPRLRRILLPPTWRGHPLRREHPARATEMGPFEMPEDRHVREEEALRFRPEEWGLEPGSDGSDYMFLNLGPQHTGTHGIIRFVLQLDGEEIVNIVPDIGYHHRGAEKMAERQSWHTFIPYTDRIDYLGGVMNNLAYLLAVEKLAGIAVPARAQCIRVMMSEFFRLASHLLWMGSFAQDVGQMSPVFYCFTERERVFDIVSAVCGDRMHPNWFRIGGVAQDLPKGWDRMVKEFIATFPKRLREVEKIFIKNRVFKARAAGIGCYTLDEAVEWGVTGPGLRACGFDWDLRKKRPYSGYENYTFEIPTGRNGDSYDRSVVRVEEMRQSCAIIRQCMEHMPEGPYKADHPLTTPPLKEYTMKHIETLITHFLNVTWGPVIPAGEAFFGIEATKGGNGYYCVSDGGVSAYRQRIRTPSFPHVQMVPYISRGHTVADLLVILGSVDYVLSDVDR